MSVKTISLDQWIEGLPPCGGGAGIHPCRAEEIHVAVVRGDTEEFERIVRQGRQELPWGKNTAAASYQPTYFCEVES
jgi:hypothetical protein